MNSGSYRVFQMVPSSAHHVIVEFVAKASSRKLMKILLMIELSAVASASTIIGENSSGTKEQVSLVKYYKQRRKFASVAPSDRSGSAKQQMPLLKGKFASIGPGDSSSGTKPQAHLLKNYYKRKRKFSIIKPHVPLLKFFNSEGGNFPLLILAVPKNILACVALHKNRKRGRKSASES
ncbi:hypothetical protein SLEP1_g7000 [Rubroshorea leprosula]|uniref:Uncharacterized protein n=1 Tax=Rubroshorea leprosula TaxID=152421 RepID=A0AAV5I5A0_9ROSI|nr:hypothetical protein SLEP1_g7000 [Rubroshorea leprosula]